MATTVDNNDKGNQGGVFRVQHDKLTDDRDGRQTMEDG